MLNVIISRVFVALVFCTFVWLNLCFATFCTGLVGLPEVVAWLWVMFGLPGNLVSAGVAGAKLLGHLRQKEEENRYTGGMEVSPWMNNKNYGLFANLFQAARNKWASYKS